MKKFLLLFALLTLGTLAPVASAAPAPPAPITIPVDPTLSPAEQKAVRSYILNAMRASVEAMLAKSETATPTLRQILRTSYNANNNLSLDGLPADYRNFILESCKLGKEALDSMQGLDKTMDQLTEEDARQMEAFLTTVVSKTQALEAQHPNVARYLGTQAMTRLSRQLTVESGIQERVMTELLSRLDEWQDDQEKLSQEALRLTCQYLLEEINKLSAE